MKLVPLGINGYYPSHGRQTMAHLVLPEGGGALLLDAGTGVGRLGDEPARTLLEGAETLDLLLTHYHLDHVVGLSILPAVLGLLPVRIHAPGKPLVDADPAETLCRLIHPPLFPIPLTEYPMPVELDRVTSESLSIAGIDVRLRRQEHPGGSLGVRLGDSLAYVTDTVADDATADFAAGVDLLLHEVWADAGDEAVGGHSAVDEVARIAVRAGVRRLMPVHHHPRRTQADLERLSAELARRAEGVEVVLPEEGRVYEVGPGRPARSP